MQPSVLIIHDEPARLSALAKGLAKAGFDATLADGHLAALEALPGTQFDLIVVKTDLPELDGRRLTATLRRPDGLNADTPVLGITTDRSPALARECWRSGINALVLSPGDERDLLAAIRPLGFEHLAPPKPEPVPVPTDDAATEAIFKALGDRRLKLFMSIAEAGELTASGVATKANISRPLALYHIEQLVDVGLLGRREHGKEVFFALRPERVAAVAQWLLNLRARYSG